LLARPYVLRAILKARGPMTMTGDAAAVTRAAMTDAAGLNRPGSMPISDSDRASRDKALDARDKRLVDAWKHPPADNTVPIAKPRRRRLLTGATLASVMLGRERTDAASDPGKSKAQPIEGAGRGGTGCRVLPTAIELRQLAC
jgi:hypothetical protein